MCTLIGLQQGYCLRQPHMTENYHHVWAMRKRNQSIY